MTTRQTPGGQAPDRKVHTQRQPSTQLAFTEDVLTRQALSRQSRSHDPPDRRRLARASCLGLLGPGGHGRVAATMKAVPVIIPVQFDVVDEDIVFSAGSDPDLLRAVANSVVAFETDHRGPDGQALWDIHVLGVAEVIAEDGQPPGFRLSTEIVTGWRVQA